MLKENCCNPTQKNEKKCNSLEPDYKCDSNEINCCDSYQQVEEETCCPPKNEENSCGCGCNTETQESISGDKEFEIVIDDKKIKVTDNSKNIVEIAKTAGITIPAPCFYAEKKKGCCKVCLVEINSKQTYACGTKPEKGMNIIVDRKDLKILRKERLLKYKEAIKNKEPLKCGEK